MLFRVNRKPFEVKVQGLQSFGGKKPRAVVASVEPSRPLIELQAELERLMQRLGLDPEGRKFIPHVTLARLHDASSQDVADYLSVRGHFPSRTFMALRFVLLSSGAIEADPAQAEAAEAFSALDERLSSYKPARKLSLLGRLFGDKSEPPPRGLYVHGEVGRGKTMLMDLFFQHSPVQHKRRAHFHEFMAEVHERIYAYRQNIARGEIADADVMALTANANF